MIHPHNDVGHRATRKAKEDDPLSRVRAAVQELHGAITDAASKQGEAVKSELKVVSKRAKAVTASVTESLGAQGEAATKSVKEAVTYLEATEKHIAESLEATGHAFESSVRRAIANAHAAAQSMSEAVATKRTGKDGHSRKAGASHA